jgi:capsid assembly protease
MNRQLLISEFLATPWALMPERLQTITGVLSRWTSGDATTHDVMVKVHADRVVRDTRKQMTAANAGNGIAVLPLYGVITQRGNMVDDISGPGSTSTQQFAAALHEAIADPAIGQILIDIDSPGGSVYGVSELAAEILKARGDKPITAIANSLAASAAYWIGSAANELYVTPGGEVGSIGVWQAHFDYSKALEEGGIKPTLISAGKFKVEGNPYSALDEQALGFMQTRVDEYYAAFVKGVAKGRGVGVDQVRTGMGEGRVLGADAAVAQGMVDGVATFDQVIAKMRTNSARNKVAHSRARVDRALFDLSLI